MQSTRNMTFIRFGAIFDNFMLKVKWYIPNRERLIAYRLRYALTLRQPQWNWSGAVLNPALSIMKIINMLLFHLKEDCSAKFLMGNPRLAQALKLNSEFQCD